MKAYSHNPLSQLFDAEVGVLCRLGIILRVKTNLRVTEMKLGTFNGCESMEPISFASCVGVDDVQMYFCHHVLSLVVFGKKERTSTDPAPSGWILQITNNEGRDIPFDDVIEVPLIGLPFGAILKSLEGCLAEAVQRIKVEKKDIYIGAKRECKQFLPKEQIKIDLLHPVTKEVLHCFWQGLMFESFQNAA